MGRCEVLAELTLDERAPEWSGLRLIEWAAVCGASGVVIPGRPWISSDVNVALCRQALSRGLVVYRERPSTEMDLRIVEDGHRSRVVEIGVNPGERLGDWLAMRRKTERNLGYTDRLPHTPRSLNAALNAALAKAPVILKGLTLNRSLGGSSHQASLYPDEFAVLVELVRETTAFLDMALKYAMSGSAVPSRATTHEMSVAETKGFVTRRPLRAGHRLEPDDFKTVQGLQGLSIDTEDRLVGTRLLYDCQADEPITFGTIEPWGPGGGGVPLDVSVVIRVKNEGAWLRRSLSALVHQARPPREILIVDNESSDDTVAVAQSFGCRVLPIADRDFSFGRTLNMGIAAARSPWIVSLSAHCIPVHDRWLEALCVRECAGPFAAAVYGRQEPLPDTSDFDKRDLWTTFGQESRLQRGQDYFFHNANSMIRKEAWARIPFDEQLNGVEDRDWAKRVLANGYVIVYSPLASVHHYHGIHQGRNVERCQRVVKIIEFIHQRDVVFEGTRRP